MTTPQVQHTPNHHLNSMAAHKAVPYKTSEFIGIVLFLVSWALQRYVVPLPSFVATEVTTQLLGLIPFIAGAMWIRWVHVELKRYKQPHEPGVPTTILITTGPFAIMRHPTYAAILFGIIPGAVLLVANPWILILMPVTALAFEFILIREEEAYLHGLFGDEWLDYCKATPRWI